MSAFLPSLQMHASQLLWVFWREHGGADLCLATAWNLGPVREPLAVFGHQLRRQLLLKCLMPPTNIQAGHRPTKFSLTLKPK